jgi:regulator of sigma E protease
MKYEAPKQNNTLKNILYVIAGLGGISLIILIHEMGHFLFAKIFNVPTPCFSLGFGPTLYALAIEQTTFKLALLPFGGYVEMDQEILNTLPYFPKILIIFAGILFNFIFAYGILFYYNVRNQSIFASTTKSTPTLQEMNSAVTKIMTSNNQQNAIIGPVGIISIIGKSLTVNPQLYWFILAVLSLNMGIFNAIPLPFFDGGKALIYTIEALTGKTISTTIVWFISTIFLALFMLLITQVTINDIKQLFKK